MNVKKHKKMDEKEFEEFSEAQRREIQKHRWIESEKAGKDVGQKATVDWINQHAEEFRDWWERKYLKKDKKAG